VTTISTLSFLPRLTGEDLKELGILSIGPRRKLLNAIARLNNVIDRSGAPTVERVPTLASKPSDPPGQREAERRQLTILFCDLVGSTPLSGRPDPEEYRSIVAGFQEACTGTITRFDGFRAKYMGDGVLAYFRLPTSS
jgi:class 3 adenylate cyclase